MMPGKSDQWKYLGGGALTLGVATAVTSRYLRGSHTQPEGAISADNQTVQVPGFKHARMVANGRDVQLTVNTLHEGFLRGMRLSNNGPCLGYRNQTKSGKPFEWITYQQVLDDATIIGAGLVGLGLTQGNNSRVGLFSQNRVEYMIIQQACYVYSLTAVPLYETLGPEACVHIINEADLEVIVCDSVEKAKGLIHSHHLTPVLKVIVILNQPSRDLVQQAEQINVRIITLSDVKNLAKQNPVPVSICKPEDTAIICYTSGTTGLPKGAIITHASLVTSCEAVNERLGVMGLGVGDTLIGYLPLAHMYEQLNEALMINCGGRIGYFQGDVISLLDDIQTLKPTMFPSVPRLLNRLYDGVIASVNESRVKKILFGIAMSSKLKDVQKGNVRKDTVWDRLVFKKVQDILGGQVRLIVTGSAPIAENVLNFFKCAAGCVVLEGYGQTETSAVATLTLHSDSQSGHVGPPLSCCMIKLVDVPEMNYFADKNYGEICIKGRNIFKGYLKQPQKTAETIDSEGWLHSGDIGTWLPNGALKIIDRKKHIFKLAQGEYIAPEKIENTYIRCPAIAQMFVHGESLQSFLVGVAVPDPDTFQKWVENNLGIRGEIMELAQNKRVKKVLLDRLTELGRESGLKSFEQVKAIHIHPELFSNENGLLTPTFKAKRPVLKEFFAKQIQEMYANTSTPSSKL